MVIADGGGGERLIVKKRTSNMFMFFRDRGEEMQTTGLTGNEI